MALEGTYSGIPVTIDLASDGTAIRIVDRHSGLILHSDTVAEFGYIQFNNSVLTIGRAAIVIDPRDAAAASTLVRSVRIKTATARLTSPAGARARTAARKMEQFGVLTAVLGALAAILVLWAGLSGDEATRPAAALTWAWGTAILLMSFVQASILIAVGAYIQSRTGDD